MLIFLVGMPATGKSSYGKILAKKLDYPLWDLDNLIYKQENKTIPEIFSEKGEVYFRKAEQNALHNLIHLNKGVIATGGGTPCFFDNMAWMNHQGLTIHIFTPIQILVKRILKDKQNKRPLFANKNEEELNQQLDVLFADRKKFYIQAKLQISFD